MKKNNLAEIKKMDIKALAEKAKQIAKEIVSLHIDKNMNKIANLKVVNQKRKDLAQTLTVINQKKLLERMEKVDAK